MGLPSADEVLPLLVVGLLAIVATLVLRPRPRLAVVAWLCSVAFVPYWLGPTVKAYLPPASAVACFLLVVYLPWRHVRPHPGDLVPVVLVALFAAASLAHATTLSVVFAVTVEWLTAYLLARVLGSVAGISWIYAAIGVVMAGVAVLALIEAATAQNFFVQLARDNTQYAVWGPLQLRGGQLRVEGAFGHSIALGVSLALAIPLTLGSRLTPRWKAVIVGLLFLASILTFSRLAMLCGVLGLVLAALFLRSALTTRQRVGIVAGLSAAVVVLLPSVLEVFSRAGTEASDSSAYRLDLISLLGSMNPVGLGSTYQRSPTGDVSFGSFSSVDSQLILLGLTQGYVALVVVLLALAAAVALVVVGRATAATIAVVALIPAFATVALITQFAALAWFVIGLAVTSQQLRAARSSAGGVGGPGDPDDTDDLDPRPESVSTLQYAHKGPAGTT